MIMLNKKFIIFLSIATIIASCKVKQSPVVVEEQSNVVEAVVNNTAVANSISPILVGTNV